MGHPPQALLDRPDLLPHLQIYWDAYQRLSKARQWSEGEPQAITVQECFAYCTVAGFASSEAKLHVLDLVQDLDQLFIEHIREKRAKASATPAKSEVVTK